MFACAARQHIATDALKVILQVRLASGDCMQKSQPQRAVATQGPRRWTSCNDDGLMHEADH